jgi:hypothetical protein
LNRVGTKSRVEHPYFKHPKSKCSKAWDFLSVHMMPSSGKFHAMKLCFMHKII